MVDLFLDPKVLNYSNDRYELILMTLKWARAMKAKGTPEPMPVLVERALKDIVENKVTIAEIMANKTVVEPVAEELPAIVSVAGEGKAVLAPDIDEDEEKKKTKKKKKKRRMILLGVTGSIAAYKAAELLRLLIKAGQDVHVVMTPSATHFVGPLTFQGLSGHPVFTETLDPQAYQMAHLALAEKADAVVVAPASAESLSHYARGGAGDLVSACLLSVPRTAAGKLKIPVYIAPAMHESMWTHPATQANVESLQRYGYIFVGPEKGALGRHGDTGYGRMAEPEAIADHILKRRAR